MTTRGQVNSNFYQIVNIDANGNPTAVKPEYITGGNVANATHANVSDVANSVSVANVVGIGNIATINKDGSSTHVLYGNGAWANIPTVSNVANANFANFAGTAYSVSGSNVSGAVNLANYATVANSVSVANVSGIGNIATVNLDGNANHVLYGNGVWANVSGGGGNTANANYANFAGTAFNVSGSNVTGQVANALVAGTVYTNAQPNITSVGTLTSANVSGNTKTSNLEVTGVVFGNLIPNSNVTQSLGNSTNRWKDLWISGNTIYLGSQTISTSNGEIVMSGTLSGDGGALSNIVGANVTGYVANATHSNIADVANSVSGANVTGYVANANHANIADVANTVAGANVTGQVAYAAVANSVAGANVTGQVSFAAVANSVAVANVVGIGNIATINLNGSSTNVLYGNGIWAGVSATNANFANYAGNVTGSSQPNITSVGTLVSLTVNDGITANTLQFNTGITPITANVGQMFWDTNEHTVTLGMENGVQQQIGLESYIYAKADSTITNGQVVMMTGANGNNITVAPANVATPGFMVQHVLGIATQDIATNGFGYITTFGLVHGLNTNSFNNGDVLWLSTTTPGAFTNIRPVDPNYQIQVATVTKKSAGDGHVQVLIYPFTPLTKLTDVEITSPVSGQALVFDGGNVWVNGYPAYANVANSVAVANVVGIGNIATINLDGNSSHVLYGNGVWAASGGTPGGSNTQLQFNNNGSFGGISTVTYNGTNISLGSITTVKITGGLSGQVMQTDGTGNLSWTTPSSSGATDFTPSFLLGGM